MTAPQALVPLALGLVAWLPFAIALRNGHRTRAALVVGVWAVALLSALPALEVAMPGVCGRLFPGATRYGDAMVEWARSGVGCESLPSCFVPQHVLHGAAFSAATVASAGMLGLAFAAVLFGWMGSYAAALGAASGQPVLAALVAWHPWAVVRVVAFVCLGVALAEPLARRGLPPLPGRRGWAVAGLLGLALDLLLKALLAPTWWRLVVHPLVNGGGVG